ncbi:Uncharacterized protein YijF [Olavius sp. associated proteobacterium Delta 1]|nr:Uncharacterized protein YijF [Olavius sp. associated proteobacterium Delta 1]
MKKLIILALLVIPGLVSAYRQGEPTDFSKKLSQAAIERTQHVVRYDGKYRKISYPNGDVPDHLGVCTDVVIRSYRKLGIDLQKDVHEDMKENFNKYPKLWGLSKPDPNIDHRRVPNLQTLFKRKGTSLPVTKNPNDFVAGDIVSWMLPGNLPHIGIVIDSRSGDDNKPHIVHNIGSGPVIEDILFDYQITGHYRYYGTLN